MPRDYDAISRYNEEQLGKDRKSRMSQVAMYADTAHFVYELLQNADDAGATEIRFLLSGDSLVVEHNGKPFDEEDVRAISYFGKGKTEVTAIGHFGLGFKSVFAYTASPRIHSTDDDFELIDLYTLRPIDQPKDLPKGRTRFVLPFDHVQRRPVYIEGSKLKRDDKARSEIGAKLKALGGATLLFTRTLREIQWTDGRGSGQYLREDTALRGGGRETLIVSGDSGDQYFLVYEKAITWPDETGIKSERRPIAIAVELDKSYRTGGRVHGPETQKLWVFFPTDKETHMGLVVQGPYRTTPARDNVPADDDFNKHLVAETAALIRSSLNAMRPLGVVDADLLSRLPLDESKFEKSTFFRPLYEAVRTALKEDPLLPTSRGKHVPAVRAKLARGQKLTELISSKQLSSLYGQDDLEWLDAAITADKYPMLYRYFVGAKQYAWDKDWIVRPLVRNIEVRVEDFAEKLSARFMDEQSDAWVLSLYRFLQEGRGQLYSHFLPRPLIRLETGKHVPPITGTRGTPNAYLPTEADSELPTVKRSLCKDKQAVEFLRELGLSTPDIVDEVIETVLPRYIGNKSVEIKVWKSDFRKILGALEGADIAKRYRLSEKLREVTWVLVQPAGKEDLYLVRPDGAYVPSDELRMYFARDEDVRFLARDYYSDHQVEALVALGVARSPRIKTRAPSYEGHVTLANYHGWHKRGLAGFDPEWAVDGLAKALAEPDLEVSAFVWNRIAVPNAHLVRGVIESSSRKTFESPRRKEEWSSTGEFLRDTAWLPDRSGGFHKPGRLMLSELPPQFDRELPQAKRLAEALAMKQPEAVKAIDALAGGNDRLKGIIERLTQGDLDDDFLDRLDKLFPRTEPVKPPPTFRDAVQAIHRKLRSQDGEGGGVRAGNVQNPERYEKQLREDIEQRKQKSPSGRAARFVVVRERDDNKEARQFLYQQYKGACQVTGQTFAKADGANYFVAVALVPYQGTEYLNHAGNLLCLSAEMAARFLYGTFEWIDDLGAKIDAFRPAAQGSSDTDRSIRIRITGEDRSIRFSEPHFLRLKALWTSG
jgi:hypothetical protein